MGTGTDSASRADDTVDDGLFASEDRLQGKALENVHTWFIKPSTATPIEKEWQPLCNLDYLWMQFYTPLICTFTLTEDQVLHRFGSVAGVVQHLKDSLAEALVWFYPLAGRLVTTDGPPRIHCNDAGAVFAEASVDVEMAELRTDEFLPLPVLSGLAAAGLDRYPTLPQMPGGLPTLIVQVTHFKCGGIALAANWSHAVADGQSGLHFMKSWSEIARGVEISLLPDHRRDLIKPRDPPIPGDLVKPVAVSPDARRIASQITAKADESSEPKKKPPIATGTVEFTKDDIAKMRRIAATDGSYLTRADCLSTHLWRTMAKARNRPHEARARLWVLVEGRKKLNLPPGYFGNVIGMTPITTTVRELLDGSFADTAALIHDGIASITAEWYQGFVDLVQASSKGTNLFTPEPLGPGAESGVSYLVRFPYYELDFGFGIPACSMRNTMGAWEGLVFVLPSRRGPDHMVAMPNLQPDDLTSFLAIAHDIPEAKP